MKMMNYVRPWVEQHTDIVLDMVRIYLGVGLQGKADAQINAHHVEDDVGVLFHPGSDVIHHFHSSSPVSLMLVTADYLKDKTFFSEGKWPCVATRPRKRSSVPYSPPSRPCRGRGRGRFA